MSNESDESRVEKARRRIEELTGQKLCPRLDAIAKAAMSRENLTKALKDLDHGEIPVKPNLKVVK